MDRSRDIESEEKNLSLYIRVGVLPIAQYLKPMQCPVSSAQCPVPSAQCPVPSAQCLVPNAKCLVPTLPSAPEAKDCI